MPALVIAVLLTTACSSGEPAPSAEDADEAPVPVEVPTLSEALGYAPNGSTLFAFADVAALKEHEGATDLAEQDFEQQEEFILDLGEQGVSLGLYPSWQFPRHAEIWGWDFGDVLWEAWIQPPGGGSAYFVALGPDFDYAGLEARLEERDYQQRDVGGFPLYSHEYSVSEPWLVDNYGASSPNAVLNMGIVDGEGVVLAGGRGPAEQVLAVHGGDPALTQDALAIGTVADLEEPVSAVLRRTGKAGCQRMWENRLTPALRREWESRYSANPHEYLAAGFYWKGDERAGRAVMAYKTKALAEDDLELRRRSAIRGISTDTWDLYRDDDFMFGGIQVSGSNLVLDVAPATSGALEIVRMMYGTDLLFAVC